MSAESIETVTVAASSLSAATPRLGRSALRIAAEDSPGERADRGPLFVRVGRWAGSAASENVSDIYVAGQDR